MTSIAWRVRMLTTAAVLFAAGASRTAAVEFGITGLFASNSQTIEISPIVGDDRGGIALSSSQVFYTGDTATGRFALADLSSGASVGAVRAFPLSDLSNGTVYVLGRVSGPFTALSPSNPLTTLHEVNGGTGALTGATISLSASVPMHASDVAIFSGWGRVIVGVPPGGGFDGAFYNIDLPSGAVSQIGGLTMMQQFIFARNPNQCAEGSVWGVAEQIGSELWIAYASSNRVVRMRAPDGLYEDFALFSGIVNICSLTVSPSNSRWYFQYPGTTQFGSGTQTLGYADATWTSMAPDADGDGTSDPYDNCPVANPGQADCDDDGVGDACDPDTSDPDGDLIDAACDNCASTANTDQANADGDQFGDACDECFGVGTEDTDLDGACDGFDNCPTVANPGQEDGNGDGSGDACDPQVTISSIVDNGIDLTANATAVSPAGLSLSGEVHVCDGTDVLNLSFTFQAFACGDIHIAFLVNGNFVEGFGGPPCLGFGSLCDTEITTLDVPVPGLTPGVNRIGLRKPVGGFPTFGVIALSWAYATITTSTGTHRVELFDQSGGDDYDNPNMCDAGYTLDFVQVQASTPLLCDSQASMSWSGTLPTCGFDISGVDDGQFTLLVTASDGVAPVPAKDLADFTHAGETQVFFNAACGDSSPCTADCDIGGGSCSHDPASAGTVCRTAAGACDAAEVCDGATTACPADVTQPDGTGCGDASFCNGDEQCLAGTCQSAAAACPFGCDEGLDQCVISCPPAPQSGCKTAAKSVLMLKDNDDDAKDKLLWKWLKGQSTMLPDFGNPQTTADYFLCLYGGVAETPLADGTLQVPHSPNWSPLGTTGWNYDDDAAAADGARKLRLQSSSQDRSKVLLKGKGSELPDVALPIAPANFPLLLQLFNSETTSCFESSFASNGVRKNDGNRFKATAP
jgi:hypothetical protein